MTGQRSAPVSAAGEDFRSLGDFGSLEVDSRWSAAHLAELADIPDRDIDGFVELRRRDFGGGNPLLERQQTLSNLRGTSP